MAHSGTVLSQLLQLVSRHLASLAEANKTGMPPDRTIANFIIVCPAATSSIHITASMRVCKFNLHMRKRLLNSQIQVRRP